MGKNSSTEMALVTQVDGLFVQVCYFNSQYTPDWVLISGLDRVFKTDGRDVGSVTPCPPVRGQHVQVPKFSGYAWGTLLEVASDYSLISYDEASGLNPAYIVTASLFGCPTRPQSVSTSLDKGDMVHIARDSGFVWARVNKVNGDLVQVTYTDKTQQWVVRACIVARTSKKMAQRALDEIFRKQKIKGGATRPNT